MIRMNTDMITACGQLNVGMGSGKGSLLARVKKYMRMES